MSIEVGKQYIGKDGQVVEVTSLPYCMSMNMVIFKDKTTLEHVLSVSDFLEQYKLATYEYMYAFMDSHNICRLPTSNFYKDDEEFKLYHPNKTEYQRLDFTKRERNQQPTKA